MRYDPLLRFKKYWRAKAIAEERGVKARILTGRNEVDLLLFTTEDGSALLQLLRRNRGTFIHLPRVSYFAVPPASDLDQRTVEVAILAANCETTEARVELITNRLGGVAISNYTWGCDEDSARLLHWNSVGWKLMTKDEDTIAWRAVEGTVGFDAEGRIPTPHLRWNAASALEESEVDFERLELDLTAKMLSAFRKSVSPGELYSVLDYNHPCYWFDPHRGVEWGYRDYWATPVFPLGDSYYYLARQNSMGVIALYPSCDFIVFGEPLVEIVTNDPPVLLSGPGNPES